MSTAMRRFVRCSLIAALFLFGFTACDTAPPSDAPPANGPDEINQSEAVVTYLDAVVDTLQTHLYFRAEVDWPAFRDDLTRAVGNAQETPQTWDAIEEEMDRIDPHSRIFFSGATSAQPSGTALTVAGSRQGDASATDSNIDGLIAERLPGDRIGYLRLPATSGLESDEYNTYDDAVQSLLADVDSTTVCGWVLDLRGNTGGIMWTMLNGVGPMFGAEKLGSYRYPDGSEAYGGWFYRDGTTYAGDQPNYSLQSQEPTVLETPTPPVAVLTDGRTASAGEAILTAFRGRAYTQSFGQPTRGVPTGLLGFEMSDGLVLIISVVASADRTGQVYTSTMEPDVLAPTGDDPNANDAIVETAQDWVLTQPACTSR